jgi:hypothetical protein
MCHIDGVRVRMAIGLPEGSEHLPSEHGRALFCKVCAAFGLPHSCKLTSLWIAYVNRAAPLSLVHFKHVFLECLTKMS